MAENGFLILARVIIKWKLGCCYHMGQGELGLFPVDSPGCFLVLPFSITMNVKGQQNNNNNNNKKKRQGHLAVSPVEMQVWIIPPSQDSPPANMLAGGEGAIE